MQIFGTNICLCVNIWRIDSRWQDCQKFENFICVHICERKWRKCFVNVFQLRLSSSTALHCTAVHYSVPFLIWVSGFSQVNWLRKVRPHVLLISQLSLTLMSRRGQEARACQQQQLCIEASVFLKLGFRNYIFQECIFQSYYQVRPGGLGMSAAARLQ